MNVTVTLTKGEAVLGRLEDAAFVAEWDRLQANCPWATSFQSFAFVDCWYRLHDALYEPVIIEGRDDDGSLVGLLTLARRRTGRLLVGAGDIHAEYQGWISEEAAAEPFMWRSLDLLGRSYPKGRLRFNYLPPDTPLVWADRDARWPRRIRFRRLSRGVIDLSDPTPIEASLRKGHNRSRLNSLRRFGEVRLETIDTVEGLEREMDEIAVLCDLRQGAIHDSLPFANNPLKRPLHIGLMERGLLRVTVLRVGDSIASAHLDMRNGDEVLIYLIVHAPAFAKYSPGSLHILMLANQLAGEGIARFDLSPGGGYKDRYATGEEPLYRMSVALGVRDRVVSDMSGRAEAAAIRLLRATGRTPRAALADARRLRANAASRLSRRQEGSPERVAGIILEVPDVAGRVADPLALDRIGDLLAYDPTGSARPSMRDFLRLALHRLEVGHRVLTRMDGPRLVECWWMCRLDGPSGDRTKTGRSAASQTLLYDPLQRSSLDGPDARIEELQRLRSTVRDVAPTTTCYLAVPVLDLALLDALAQMGATRLAEISDGAGAGGVTVRLADGLAPELASPIDAAASQIAAGWPADRRPPS